MNGLTAVIKQTDNFDENSDAAGINFQGHEDLCRQEDAKFTDVNYQLMQFGMNPFGPRIPEFGTVDYNIDKQQALMVVNDARYAFKRLPAELRQKYPSWPELLAAAQRGELANIDLTTGKERAKPSPTPTPEAPRA